MGTTSPNEQLNQDGRLNLDQAVARHKQIAPKQHTHFGSKFAKSKCFHHLQDTQEVTENAERELQIPLHPVAQPYSFKSHGSSLYLKIG